LIEYYFGWDDLRSVTNDDLGGVFVGHDDGGAGESGAVSQWMVRLEGLLDHASVQVRSDLVHITANKQNNKVRKCASSGYLNGHSPGGGLISTYWEMEVVSADFLAAMSIGLALVAWNALQTAWPFLMKTAEQEVTRVF